MTKPDKANAEAELAKKAEVMTEADLESATKKKKSLERKLGGVPAKLAQLKNQVSLLFEMIGDYRSGVYRQVPWRTIAMAVAAFTYFLSPIDAIPDFILGVGFIDDALVVSLAAKSLRKDLSKYCTHKGYDADKYFR
jgi:uncharacterized membrane protein YkvA (DUF1232 family)